MPILDTQWLLHALGKTPSQKSKAWNRTLHRTCQSDQCSKDRILTGQAHWLNVAKSAFLGVVACYCAVSMFFVLYDVFLFLQFASANLWEFAHRQTLCCELLTAGRRSNQPSWMSFFLRAHWITPFLSWLQTNLTSHSILQAVSSLHPRPCPCAHSRLWAVVLPTPSAGSLPWKLKPKFLETGTKIHPIALIGQKKWNL